MHFSPKISILPAALVLLHLTGCSSTRKTTTTLPVETVISMEDIDVIAKPKSADVFQPAATRLWELLHTQIKIGFRIPQREAVGEATLFLKPYAYEQKELALDARSMKIEKVVCSYKGRISTLSFRYENDKLILPLDRNFQPEDTLRVVIDYVAMPYASTNSGSAAIRDDRGLYFVNAEGNIPGKPLQIWTQGETESNSHWFPTIDKPNQRSTFQFEITVPDSLTVLSNGVRFSEKKDGMGMKTSIWQMKDPIPRYLTMMAIGKFQRVTDSAVNGTPVHYYLEPQYAPYAKAIFPNTPGMIAFFSRYTGIKFPWPKYSQVAVRDYVSGAMENTSASLFGEFVNGDAQEHKDQSFEDVVAHELFHQWFGDLVTAKSWSNLTVNESFATLGEMLWRNYHYGPESSDVLRLQYLHRYLAGAEQKDPPLLRHLYASEGEMFDHVSYQKGGLILYNMRDMMGDEVFHNALKTYLMNNAHAPADVYDWKKAVEEVTGQDWTEFFNNWYLNGGHSNVTFRFFNDSVHNRTGIIAERGERYYQTTLRVLAMNETGWQQQYVWHLYEQRDTMYVPNTSGAAPLIVPDVRLNIVGKTHTLKPQTEWVRQLNLTTGVLPRYEALVHLLNADFSAPAWQAITQMLDNGHDFLQEKALDELAGKKGARLSQLGFTNQLRRLVNDPKESADVRVSALSLYAQCDSSKENATWYRQLINDSSYKVSGEALSQYHVTDSVAALQLARQRLEAGSARADFLSNALMVVAATGLPEDLRRIENTTAGKWGNEKYRFLNAAMAYWISSENDNDAPLRLLKNWYSEEEASFVRNRHLNVWSMMVTIALQNAQQTAWRPRKESFSAFLETMAKAQNDTALKNRIEKLRKRLNGEA